MYGYLAENPKKKNETSLREYLRNIFVRHDIVYDEVIPVDILKSRGATNIRKFRPDARIERLSLIIELDGIDHYNRISVILQDVEKYVYLEDLGYTVIRIPFYVQLNPETIKYYFDIDSNIRCEYTSGFHSSTSSEFGLNHSNPANFCSLGWNRFNIEYAKMPDRTKKEIMSTLLLQCRLHENMFVIPVICLEDDPVIQDLIHYDEFPDQLYGFGYERIQESPYCKGSND